MLHMWSSKVLLCSSSGIEVFIIFLLPVFIGEEKVVWYESPLVFGYSYLEGEKRNCTVLCGCMLV